MVNTDIERAYVYALETCSQRLELLVARCWHQHPPAARPWHLNRCRGYTPADEHTTYDDFILTLTCGFFEGFYIDRCFSLEGQFAAIVRTAAYQADENKHLMLKMSNELWDRCDRRFTWVKFMIVPRERFVGTGLTEAPEMRSLRLQLEGPVSPDDK